MTAREELHRLLDRIPEGDIPTVRKFLCSLADPAGSASVDDEPQSAVDAAFAGDASDIPFARIRRYTR